MAGGDKPPLPDLGAKFEVIEPIGSGGMGAVYRARHLRLDQIRAVKVLAGDASPRATERLRREAATAIRLAHPNIVTVYDLEELPDGGLAIVMEALEGEGLDRLVERDGPLEVERICGMFRGVCDGLDRMHQAGVIHRDLKPSNLFVCDDGTLKILDFGVARVFEQASELTRPGQAIGTPAFMAPEQYEGQQLTPRVDVYALSAVLYYTVTGRPPLSASTRAELITRVLLTEPPLASELRRDLPAGAAEVLARGLAKAPERRFETAGQLLDALEHALATADTVSPSGDTPTPGPPHKEERATPRSWVRLLGWGALACLVVGAAALAWKGTHPPRPLLWSEPPSLTRLVAEPGLQLQAALSPDGAQVVYSDMTDLFLMPTGGGPAQNLTAEFDPASRQPTWSWDGTRLAFTGDDTLYVMDVGEWSPRPLVEGAYWPTWSPDGQRLAYTTGDLGPPYMMPRLVSELWTVDVETGQRQCLVPDGKAYLPDWSREGDRIVFNDTMSIVSIGPDGGEPTQLIPDRAWSPLWLSRADQLFIVTDRGDMTAVKLIQVDPGGAGDGEQEILSIPLSADFAGDLSLSADDRMLAFTVIVNTTHLYRVTLDPASAMPQDALQPVTSGNQRYACPGFAPDGQSIVYTSYGKHENLHVAQLDGSGERALSTGETLTRGPRWSPDGQTLVFYGIRDGRQGIWSVDRDGGSLRCLHSDPETEAVVPLWSPDGGRLAFTDSSPQPFVIDLQRGWDEQLAEQRRAGARGWFATSWSPDGRWLAVSRSGTGIGRMDVDTGEIEPLVERGYYPIWMADSRRMLVGDNDRVFLLDTETREVSDVLMLAPGHIPGTTSMALSPDDRTLIVAVNQADADIWLAESGPRVP